jgi:predicted nucleic acid-binding protein
MSTSAIFNASPLIILAKSHRQNLALAAGDARFIPSQVVTELSHAGPNDPAFLLAKSTLFEIVEVPSVPAAIQNERLGLGESGVLALGFTKRCDHLILDDLAARRAAIRHGFIVHGTLWLAVEAKKRGLIPRVVPVLDDFEHVGMFLEPRLLKLILTAAGE